MLRQTLALGLLITGLIIGVIANAFFYERSLGLSVPIFVMILLIATIAWTWIYNERPSLRKIWIIPILFFAIMFVFRANPTILLLNGLAIIVLFALLLHYLNHEIHLDSASNQDHMQGIVETTAHSLVGTGTEIEHSYKWIKGREWNDLSSLIAVGRGLLIAIPIILVFGFLFSSADAIFSERISNVFDMFAFERLEIFSTRFFLTLGIAWLATGLLSFGMKQRSTKHNDRPLDLEDLSDDLAKTTPKPFSLGMTETSIILMSVVGLFGFFVFIQLTYFFAGEVAIAEGLTYSDYARRGFFELLAVSVLVLGLMLILDHLAIRKTATDRSIFLALSAIMVGLTLVIMVSAWQRMALYEQAYGFTYLRVYSHVFIAWLGILLAIGLLHLFRIRANIFAFGVICVAIGYIGTLNLMNIDLYIAERNIARYENGEELDACYLRRLSVDALPAMLDLYNSTDDMWIKADLAAWLRLQRRITNSRLSETSILEFNLAYQRVDQSLQDMNLEDTTEDARTCNYYRGF